MEPKNFHLNPHIVEAFESQGFKIEPNYSSKDDFTIDVQFPKFTDEFSKNFSDLKIQVCCQDYEIPDEFFSNIIFIDNWTNANDFHWNTPIAIKTQSLLDSADKSKHFKILSDMLAFSSEIKDKINIINKSLLEIWSNEYPTITINDVVNAENDNGPRKLMSNPVWFRIFNSAPNFKYKFNISEDGKKITIGKGNVKWYGYTFHDVSFSFDGTIKNFLNSFHDFIFEKNFEDRIINKGTFWKKEDWWFWEPQLTMYYKNKMFEDYTAMFYEAKIIAKESLKDFIFLKEYEEPYNINNQTNLSAHRMDKLLGTSKLRISAEVLEAIDNSRFINLGIEQKGRYSFCARILNEHTPKDFIGLFFDGTDKDLLKSIQHCTKSFISHGHQTPLAHDFRDLEDSVKEAIKCHDFRVELNDLEERVEKFSTSDSILDHLENEKKLTKMKEEAWKYGIKKYLPQTKQEENKERKYEPTIFKE